MQSRYTMHVKPTQRDYSTRMVLVPYRQLSPEALAGVIEEFVSRDGTELTDVNTKIAQVRTQIEEGRAVITFDPESGTCNVLPAEHMRNR